METMLAKLRSGVKYDVAFPEAQTAAQLVKANFLAPLDHSKLPNWAQVNAAFHNPWYDAGAKYSVPYAIWTTGIAYRTDKVKGMTGSWNDLFNHPEAAKHTYLLDDFREVLGMGLLATGTKDVNSTSSSAVGKAQAKVLKLKPRLRGFTSVNTEMANGTSWLTHMWSGTVYQALLAIEAPGAAPLPDQQGRHPGRQRHDGAAQERAAPEHRDALHRLHAAARELLGERRVHRLSDDDDGGPEDLRRPHEEVPVAEGHDRPRSSTASGSSRRIRRRCSSGTPPGRRSRRRAGTTRCGAASGRASSFRRASGSSRSIWSRSGLIVAASFGTVDFLGRVIYAWPFYGWDLSNYHTVLVVGTICRRSSARSRSPR